MNEVVNKYRIGYVDEEPQFIAKFKRKLKDSFEIINFDLTPDTALTELIQEIEEADLDCLVVDFELKEAAVVQFNGDEIIDAIREKYPFFPVFIITSKEEDDVLDQVDDGDIVRLKDELDSKLPILIQRITNKIENYFRLIRKAESTIQELIGKRNAGNALSIEEEELLTEQYLFLEKIDPSEKALPDNFIQPESISKFNEFASEAKEILQQLKNIQDNG